METNTKTWLNDLEALPLSIVSSSPHGQGLFAPTNVPSYMGVSLRHWAVVRESRATLPRLVIDTRYGGKWAFVSITFGLVSYPISSDSTRRDSP